MIIDVFYDAEKRQTDISCGTVQMDTVRIAGTLLSEWIMPFHIKGMRWLGISEELRQFAGTDEPFSVRYHGPEEAYQLFADTLTAAGIPLEEPELQKAEPVVSEPVPAVQTEPVQPAEPEIPAQMMQQPDSAKAPRITAKQILLLCGAVVSAGLLAAFLLDIRKTHSEYKELLAQSAALKAESVKQSQNTQSAEETQPAESSAEEVPDPEQITDAAAQTSESAAITETTVPEEPESSAFYPYLLLAHFTNTIKHLFYGAFTRRI